MVIEKSVLFLLPMPLNLAKDREVRGLFNNLFPCGLHGQKLILLFQIVSVFTLMLVLKINSLIKSNSNNKNKNMRIIMIVSIVIP